ncbi:hypothetical protein ThidrDRAFT_4154 [Thiorhodococcus drewsii AZ1]|uniref:Uncharacterized protein n=1 Tax=Thiorhodococcus drewsii AZ1 TaxID=765913 RepID=G2E791_9GAMM|nr:hypothetical protein [Thiorhodococcus drewsii]EGV28058.1 hypothetical protein ThidrDRAFT_4154 [Thiorhodococcus drewsii AZ1]
MRKCKLHAWLIRLQHWLAEAKLICDALFVSFCLLLPVFVFHNNPSILCSGYLFQLFGIVVAIKSLLSVRGYFNQRPIHEILWAWIKRFPKWNNHICTEAPSLPLPIGLGKPSFYQWYELDPKKTIEERVEILAKNLDLIRDLQKKQDSLVSRLEINYENNKQETLNQFRQVKSDVYADFQDLHTSDLFASVIGLVWVAIGITMSTFSHQISKIFN